MLSVTVRLAVAALPLELNVTEMVQLLPAVSELDGLGQVLVCTKLLAFAPVTPMLLMINGVIPGLLRVTVFGVLLLPVLTVPKLRLVGLRLARG